MKRSERGANLVEFAIVLPLLLLILAGVVDFGYAFHDYIIITNAGREGARVASRLPCRTGDATQRASLDAQIRSAVNADAVMLKPGGTTTIVITPNPVGAGTVCPAAAGSPFSVRVTRDFPVLLGSFVGQPTLTLSSQTSMAWFGND
jgi:Flp pilus assembly protein TadG